MGQGSPSKKMSLPAPKGLRCKYCRYTLIEGEQQFVQHEPSSVIPTAFLHKDKARSLSAPKCSSYFVEDQKWILAGLEDLESTKEGQISCPKCKHKVGAWSWVGLQCSCGSWVNPAFCFPKSKVDPINHAPPASIRSPNLPSA